MRQKVIYYTDEEKDEFSEIKWKEKEFSYERFEKDYPFLHFILIRILGIPISRIYMKLLYGHRIKDESEGMAEREGFFIYGNHTNAIPDVMIPFLLFRKREVHVVAGRGNCSIPIIGTLLPALGAIPLPRGKRETLIFKELIEKNIVRDGGIMIYPEAHIWPFYTEIRNFPDSSMGYPARINAPCYVVTNIYRKRLFHRRPRMITYLDGPVYPDMTLGVLQRKEKLHDEIYGIMARRSRENNVEHVLYVKKPSLESGVEAEKPTLETEGEAKKGRKNGT